MAEILLSICIPTYNRAYYLEKCLTAFFSQMDSNTAALIEICVSNNASTDNTDDVIDDCRSRGHVIHYNKNNTNLGPDANVGFCFAEAKGKYVWICGDDDFLMPGFLPKIISLLQENEIGILYMNSTWYFDEKDIRYNDVAGFSYTMYTDPLEFFKKINYWITFASGNIINKSSLPKIDWLNQNRDTNLIQLGWMLPAIFKNTNNIIIDTPIMACKGDNSGGYNLVRVFGNNFNTVLDDHIKRQIIPPQAKNIVQDNLIKTFFPLFIKPSLSKAYFGTLKQLSGLYAHKISFYWYCILFPVLKKVKRKLFNKGK